MKQALLFLVLLALLVLPAAAEETAADAALPAAAESPLFAETGIPAFLLTSEDLTDGAWDPAIAKAGGKNVSPQLSWEPVPGAACYVVYMVDTNAFDFVHWMSNNVTEHLLPRGWAAATEYIGPYPPPGESHSYDIYVLALGQPVEDLKSSLNVANVFFTKNVMYLDAPAEGITGNLLGYGYLSGTCAAGN